MFKNLFSKNLVSQATAEAFYKTGNDCLMAGKLELAVENYRQAVLIKPDFSDAYCNLGVALKELGELDAAIESYRHALAIAPDDAEIYSNLGEALWKQGNFDAAIETYQHALALHPNAAGVYNNLGTAFKDKGELDKAIESYQRALALDPDYSDAYGNLGNVFQQQHKLTLAIASYQKLLELNPGSVEVHNHLGVLFKEAGNHPAAIKHYRQALLLNPDYADAGFNLGLSLLHLGQFTEGWRYYEFRYHPEIKNRTSVWPDFNFPQWQGESLSGKSLLIWHEQGLGDQIQFCRYVTVLKKQGAKRITWICQKSLQALLGTLNGVDAVLTEEELSSMPAHDFWTFTLSLPLHCKTTLDNIPAQIPYLYADEKQIQRIASELSAVRELKVGLCWKGNPKFPDDAQRSPGIAPFNPLFKLAGVKFFALQPNTRDELLNAAGHAALDRGHEINADSFAEAAALIMNLDLVISSCTSICHLAGSLGKPVWIVLPFSADWRWLEQREDSPWYPNACLFRQVETGNWQEVFQRVEQRLKNVIAGTEPIIRPVRV